MRHTGQPTIILAKTVKGYGMGAAGEGQNIAHQQKKLDLDALKEFRDRFNIPIADKDLDKLPYYKPAEDSVELQYLKERREALGGSLPARRTQGRRCRTRHWSFQDASSTAPANARSRPRWRSCAS